MSDLQGESSSSGSSLHGSCRASVPHATVTAQVPHATVTAQVLEDEDSRDAGASTGNHCSSGAAMGGGGVAIGSSRRRSKASLHDHECWGYLLSGVRCDATKRGVAIRGTSHFYSHFCAACHTEGVRIPVDRLRILSKEVAQGARVRRATTHWHPRPLRAACVPQS